MLLEEDVPNKPSSPKNLEPMSVEELEEYIKDLENEIKRVKADIENKKVQAEAAESIFK